MEDLAYEKALGFELRYNYIVYTCWAARLINPDYCPIEDLVRKTMTRNLLCSSCSSDRMFLTFYILYLSICKQGGCLKDLIPYKDYISNYSPSWIIYNSWEPLFYFIQTDPKLGGQLCNAAAAEDLYNNFKSDEIDQVYASYDIARCINMSFCSDF